MDSALFPPASPVPLPEISHVGLLSRWPLYYCRLPSPTSWSLNAMLTSQFGDVKKDIVLFGENKSVEDFLEDYFGFHHHQLPLTDVLLALYPIILAISLTAALQKQTGLSSIGRQKEQADEAQEGGKRRNREKQITERKAVVVEMYRKQPTLHTDLRKLQGG
ncbi:hypothetical protein LXL04_030371 [Taraxacum kok-saghyz]